MSRSPIWSTSIPRCGLSPAPRAPLRGRPGTTSAPRLPSGEIGPRQGLPWKLIGLTAALLAIRLVIGALLPLTEDEAYYRIWALTPALGYYDHPPMVAWWIWLGSHLVGDDPLGVRLIAILSSTLTSFLVFDLTRLAGATGSDAERAGIWYNA